MCEQASELLPDEITGGITLLCKWTKHKRGLPHGLLFSTRPFNLYELYLLNRDAYDSGIQPELRKIVLAVRGFKLGEKAPTCDPPGFLQIPDGQPPPKITIAVSSWQTPLASWTASVTRMVEPDVQRYTRICRLINEVLAEKRSSRYLVLPELALPARWFVRIARKLYRSGISLISGVEYLHTTKSRVRNQAWAALTHDGLGFPALMVYRQDKQRPALHEERELKRLANRVLLPEKTWKVPPIIQHGGFRFALLICSELTNIRYRTALRGKVDALFVLAWNQDIETFNSLIESAALDIHAYIIQCNDRRYGDSRIRAPYKDGWKRDVLRVKGGLADYCVIGEIDVQALRSFQSSYRSSNKPFKPTPDGFSLQYARRILPLTDDGH